MMLSLLMLAGAAEVQQATARAAFDAWLAAVNAGDDAALERFRTTWRYAGSVEELQDLRGFTGGFTLVAVTAAEPRRLVARVAARDGDMSERSVTIGFADDGALRVATARLPIARLTQAAAMEGFAQRVDDVVKADRFAGTVLVARHGKVVFARAYGLADRARGTPMTLATRLRFASVGKMFTAVAVLRLVAEGRVTLDGHVGDYLPAYPNRDVAAKVTVRQLLTHSGGTGEQINLADDWKGDNATLKTLADYVARQGDRAPLFAPGSKDDYSNYGYLLLGRIVEAVTRRDFYAAIERLVFHPAAMTHTGYAPESVPVPGRAPSYAKRDGRWVDVTATKPWRGTPGGGGYTTVGDLLAFATALQGGKLLPAPLLAQALSPQDHDGRYGFGFVVVGKGAELRWGHGGDAEGEAADFRVLPAGGWVMASLDNRDMRENYRLFRWLEPRLPLD